MQDVHTEESSKGTQTADTAFIIRHLKPEEADAVAAMEQICFPPNEACAPDMMRARGLHLPETFFVAEDTKTGKPAGMINWMCTDEETFRDAFLSDASQHQPDGKNAMVLGLEVLPEYRGLHLASRLMAAFLEAVRKDGRSRAVLTCHEEKIPMYTKMGFTDLGLSASVWGGVPWHEMEVRF